MLCSLVSVLVMDGRVPDHTTISSRARKLGKLTNAMYRCKTIIGPVMRARTLQGQKIESRVGCRILNRMAALGMPESHRVD
jgi:hypothetical protein